MSNNYQKYQILAHMKVLANLRTPSAWVSSNNALGPCYGIVIVKDVFTGDADSIKASLESGYIDYKVSPWAMYKSLSRNCQNFFFCRQTTLFSYLVQFRSPNCLLWRGPS